MVLFLRSTVKALRFEWSWASCATKITLRTNLFLIFKVAVHASAFRIRIETSKRFITTSKTISDKRSLAFTTREMTWLAFGRLVEQQKFKIKGKLKEKIKNCL
jgi:hypothetical protein